MTIFNSVYKSFKEWDMDKWTLAQTSSWLSQTWWGWVFFNPDGTKIYLTQYYNNWRIYESSLQNPYDLSNIDFSTYMSVAHPEDIHFSSDGTKMFIIKVDAAPIGLIRYTLSTAWDITTATQDQVINGNTSDRWLYITPDGENIYISNKTNNSIIRYTLSTAWDLTTAWSSTTVSNSLGGIWIWFGDNWKMFFSQQEGSSDLNYYNLSTPYDLSTATLGWAKSVWANRAGWIWFNDNWTICVMVWWWSNTNYVTKYTL